MWWIAGACRGTPRGSLHFRGIPPLGYAAEVALPGRSKNRRECPTLNGIFYAAGPNVKPRLPRFPKPVEDQDHIPTPLVQSRCHGECRRSRNDGQPRETLTGVGFEDECQP